MMTSSSIVLEKLRAVSRPAVAVWLASALVASAGEPSLEFRKDCEALTRNPHRLAGSAEGAAAAAYIAQRLSEAGVSHVIVEPFPTAQTVVKRCEMRVEGSARRLPLEPMRPNVIIPPVTPPEGLSGRLVVLDKGGFKEFENREVRDALVVMDYNSGDGWMRAFRFGAKAVVFVRRSACEAVHAHYVEVPANLPRFYYAGHPDDLAEGQNAVIHSETAWQPCTGRNVIGFIPGTAPEFNQGLPETVILAAAMDSFGEVPRLSPGARPAANCAALLKLARHFAAHPSRRNICVAFFDNEARQHTGASVFYRAMENDRKRWKKAMAEGRRESYEREKTFNENMRSLLAKENPLEGDSEIRRQLLVRLVGKAAERDFNVKTALFKLREEQLEIRKRKTSSPADTARSDEISRMIKTVCDPDKQKWTELRRVLDKLGRARTDTDVSRLDEGVRSRLNMVLDDVAREISLRLAELAKDKALIDADTEIWKLAGNTWISLHASLLLGDATPRWAVIAGGDSEIRSPKEDNSGLYGKVTSAFLRAYRALPESQRPSLNFAVESVDQAVSYPRILWASPQLLHSGAIAGLIGYYNVALGTCHEGLGREGTPDDTLDRLDLARIENQAAAACRLLSAVSMLDETPDRGAAAAPGESLKMDDALTDQEGLSLRRGITSYRNYVPSTFEDNMIKGPQVMGTLQGSSIPNTPVPGAVIMFRIMNVPFLSYEPRKPYAFDRFQVKMSDMNGAYEIGPVRVLGPDWNWRYSGFAAVLDERGAVAMASDQASHRQIRLRMNVFPCYSGYEVLPPQIFPVKNAASMKLLSSRSGSVLDGKKSFFEMGDGVAAWFVTDREKGVKFFSLDQGVGLNNGAADDHTAFLMESTRTGRKKIAGDGFRMDQGWPPIPASVRSASDLWRLNDSRIDVLRKKDILDSSLAELHGRSEDLLALSEAEKSPLRKMAMATSSFWASAPAYTKTMSMLNDIVFAVLILLGLSVPFAFALERVAIGSVTIYKQLGWFAGFFVLTFLILYVSHPAFAVANTPIIIFLGFAIVVMSSLVISIIMGKFEAELKAMQGLTGTVHVADVSRMGTFMAAMQMGVSTMRRRPLRTALTAVTIILLTFTILCFASFSTQSGIVTILKGPKPAYCGALVHDVDWRALSPDLMEVLYGRWGAQARIRQRLWISSKNAVLPNDMATSFGSGSSGLALSSEKANTTVSIRGLLGIDPAELADRPDLGKVAGGLSDDLILMTQPVARMLQVSEGDRVSAAGQPFKVGPILDNSRMIEAKDMDGGSILPVDFTEQTSGSQAPATGAGLMSASRSWTSLNPDDIVIVTATTAARLGAQIQAITLYVDDDTKAVRLAEDLARILPLPIAGTRSDGVFLHVLGTVLAASGLKDLFFPILLGGLVIFGTMLGSVADREREIYTFSALGLAPRHVATLFFSESIVYSLIGGMGGYLLAQLTMKILTLMSHYGWVRVPEMNMSSTNTIVTILIVMLTVLVSAIYPARKASQSANPGLMRSWKPPPPRGNVMDMVFPFTVSEYDITGVVSFLKEHFDNHNDTGLGHFIADDSRIVKDEKGMLGLNSHLALAPFDLGVSQTFQLSSTPSEIAGIDEVRIRLERVSGQPGDWQRLNKVFLDDLRQQFLLWRSLPHEAMDTYRGQTLAGLGRKPG